MFASLSSRLHWPSVAAALALPLPGEALPVRITCPSCRAADALLITDDTTKNGFWHHCQNCSASGDIIALVALCRQTKPTAAVEWLVREGLLVDDANCTTRWQRDQEKQDDGVALWTKSQQRAMRGLPPGLNKLAQHLGLLSGLATERWHEGPGRLLGWADKADVELALNNAYDAAPLQGPGYWYRHSALPGRRWTQALLLPFWGAPGRLNSFLVIGRDGARARDWVFHSLRTEAEPGLFGLHESLHLSAFADGTIVSLPDPILVLRLQIRHYHTASVPLPLLAPWWCSETRHTLHSWLQLAGRRLVHWAFFGLDLPTLSYAARTNGLICLRGPQNDEPGNILHYLRLKSPADHVRDIVRRARPWPDATAVWMSGQPDQAVTELLGRLQRVLPGGMDLFAELPRGAAARARTLLEAAAKRQFQVWQYSTRDKVIERDGSVFLQRGTEVLKLANLLLRFDESYDSEDGVKYCGRVIHDGRTYPFKGVPAAWVERPVAWLRKFCTRLRIPVWLSTSQTVNHYLFPAATAISPPRCNSRLTDTPTPPDERLDAPRHCSR